MPGQVKRLLIFVVIICVLFVVSRVLLVPEGFGKYGHYRATAIDTIIALPINYAGHIVCNDCHDDIAETKDASYHQGVNCESCHGPSNDHVQSLEEDEIILPSAPRDRNQCSICHAYSPAKATGFPQIDVVTHNPVKPCISCHDPHAPDPPSVIGGCIACHRGITRTKALSAHSNIECNECHTTQDEHMVNPRAFRPDKPRSRDLCGKCHAKGATSETFTKKVDMTEHGVGYLCWQCHFPHHPEAN
ncbi:MAG: hypothetical protein HN356_13860 [Calditrichaeota bacterium]|jgi:hypothetical protein|nr:hypothetical protein [Calditrichota bacterium]MBT7616449.1 hypothetical protein [Calditrichota bacterium]MBT7789406.1 hypothetical protein [Calditrichota bacterium]